MTNRIAIYYHLNLLLYQYYPINIRYKFRFMKAGTCFEVDLYFSATNLMSKDTFSKSDPFLTMAMQQSMHGNVQPLGRTETQPNTTYPTWNQKITAQYYFEVKQYVLLEVYD